MSNKYNLSNLFLNILEKKNIIVIIMVNDNIQINQCRVCRGKKKKQTMLMFHLLNESNPDQNINTITIFIKIILKIISRAVQLKNTITLVSKQQK